MESRTEKYYNDNSSNCGSSRSERNERLYKQVYGKYGDLDNLPIDDNTDEIDMARLKELLLNNERKSEDKEIRNSLNVLEQKKRNIDEQRVYDINKILEKAKNENSKLKDTSSNLYQTSRNILSTLGTSELLIDEVRNASLAYQERLLENKKVKENEEKLSMTRELKYQNLMEEKVQENDNDLSLDLFDDLRPTGNTIVTKPIKEESIEVKQVNGDFHSSDTRDIDIIKTPTKQVDSDFFTSSYEFSKKDFADEEDDFFDMKEKKGGIFKIILLVLMITVFVGVIVYFVGTYGLGI